MTRPYQIIFVSMLATTALLLGACQPKAPPAAVGTVTSADQVAIQYQVLATAIRRWCSCTAGLATAATGTNRSSISAGAIKSCGSTLRAR